MNKRTHGALSTIHLNLVCSMTTLRKKCLDLLIPPLGPRVCVRTEYVLHDDLYSIPFNLICNMTTFRKKCFDLSRVRIESVLYALFLLN